MFGMIRSLVWLAALAVVLWAALTIPLGKYTMWGHMKRVWHSQETQEMVQGTEEAARPAVEKVKKAVKAGVDEARKNP